MRILVDMDGVVADFMTPILDMYNNDYNDNLTAFDICYHGLHDIVKEECGRNVYRYFHKRGLFIGLKPIDGAIEHVTALQRANNEIIFVTKPVGHSLSCVAEKQSWVDKYFPTIGSENMVFTGKKHLVHGTVLIDDLASNLYWFSGRKILFDQPWNQKLDVDAEFNYVRVSGWEAVSALLT